MKLSLRRLLLCLAVLAAAAPALAQIKPGRDPNQPVDEEYTGKIREYTTEPYFASPLVDYLPASQTVPTPKAVLGDIAGAPGKLPYAADVYKYMRMLEKASPRVRVFSIGKTEEGREMIAVAVASEKLLAQLEENNARLSHLADPRTINLDDAEADRLVAQSTPVYYITGTIHSPETGAPTALMELAYRLAVDESPYIKNIRDNLITLITPVVEVDGRDRMVDVYNWHLAHPGENYPPLIYWGHYVAHDNNRDAMGLTLNLTRNVLDTYVRWHAQVLHDLHESVPYLYDNTIGDGPYNAWLDPILTDEWQMIGWNNVSEMTKFGMPGVFAHGTFDTWSPGYLMFIAATHNGISRLYETFGNGGADTEVRTLSPSEYSRAWYRQNPPLPRARWSQRNNNNYEETGLLTSLQYFANNKQLFLKNFYLKSKRSVLKPQNEGPAAYVFPADDPRPGTQAELLRVLQLQGCEISRATAPFTVNIPSRRRTSTDNRPTAPAATGNANAQTTQQARPEGERRETGEQANTNQAPPASRPSANAPTETRQFPAGSYIVRMDQPYSRIADALLDYQYWSPHDPQQQPYDDTGWTFGELYNVRVVRVTDTSVLQAQMERVSGPARARGGVEGSGTVFVANHNADDALVTLRYRLKGADISAAEEPFNAAGQNFNRGSFIIRNVAAAELNRVTTDLDLRTIALADAPNVKTHPIRAARIALLHTWLSTQDEGWWRMAFDKLQVPYDYISTQDVSRDANLNAKYDVIVFAPVGRNPQAVVAGMPMWGNPIPWKTTPLTPNIGKIDSTNDMRPGLGDAGLANLRAFVRRGGLLITATDTSSLAVTYNLTQGVSASQPQRMKLVGSVLRARFVDPTSPIAYGYADTLSVYADDPPIFGLSNIAGGRGGRRAAGGEERETGRGTVGDPDVVQGRPPAEIPEEPHAEIWEALPLGEEQARNNPYVIPPAERPRVVLRYGDARDLLVSGLLDNGVELAQHAAVVDVPVERGHVVLFSNNPVWRGETHGSYFLVFNAILNFDNLDAGRRLDLRVPR